MSEKPQDICDDYGFYFLDDVEAPAAELIGVGKESRFSNQYYWDNTDRQPCYLFQYTLQGSGILETENEQRIIEKGQAFFLEIPNPEKYFFDEKRNESPWEFVYILFGGSGVKAYFDYFIRKFGKITFFEYGHPAIRSLLEIYVKARSGQISNAFAAGKSVFEFLCFLCGAETQERKVYSDLISRAASYIENHYTDQIALSDVAEYLQVSQSHLSREFLKETGEQPIRFLTRVRLEKATELLNSSDMSVQKISAACGFADGNYFNKVFRRYMKISPGKFRKQVKAEGYINIQI